MRPSALRQKVLPKKINTTDVEVTTQSCRYDVWGNMVQEEREEN